MKTKLILGISSIGLIALTSLTGCQKKSKAVTYANNAAALEMSVKALEERVLGAYTAKYEEGAKITDPTKTVERFEKFAEAEYSLIFEEAIIAPWQGRNGVSATVAKTVARQAGKASYGLTADKFKNVVVTPNAITKEQRAAIDAEYERGKAVSVAVVADDEGWVPLTNAHSNPALDAENKYTYAGIKFDTKSEFKTTYTKDPDKAFLNYLTNSWTYNSYHYCNMVDGLVENDKYGNIVGSLADKYQVIENEDGTETWKFHLRDGIKWVKNSDGSDVAPVKAQDFVAGLKYVLDARNGSNTAGIVTGFIKGSAEYYAESQKEEPHLDFDKVGVKAEADNIVAYTIVEPAPYFITALTYSPFLPVNEAFLESEGSNFGKTVNNLLVNGAFRITKHEQGSVMEYTKNDKYWDKDHVYVDKVTRTFVPGTAGPSTTREWYESGKVDSFTVSSADPTGWARYVKGEAGTGTQKNPAHPSCNATTSYGTATYIGYMNFNRSKWEYNDASFRKDNVEALATAKALLSKNFRLGFLYGMKAEEMLKYYQPDEPYNYCMRGYTNRELVSAGGKDYCDYVDEVYNRKQGTTGVSLTGILNNGDPVYNKAKANAYFKAAKAELIANSGLKESDFPIKIDVIGDMSPEFNAYYEAMYKTIDESGEGIVKININIPATDDQDTDWGSISNNYDFSLWSGWGPDYADPNTFLHTMIVGGDMVEQFGF